MKPYTIRIRDRHLARAIVDAFVDGMNTDNPSPDQREAVAIMTRLDEWADGIK